MMDAKLLFLSFLVIVYLSKVQCHQPMFLKTSEANTFLNRHRRGDLHTSYAKESESSLEHPYHDTNRCSNNPCQNSAICINGANSYSCSCIPGFAGTNCETNIDECASNPCQNGAMCHDAVNSYTCRCTEDFTGANCETDMCIPGTADIVFLLDGSQSQSSHSFERQRQYVKRFVKQFPVGVANTHISVVTFSWEATVHFNLDTFTTKTSVLDAIDAIPLSDGPSLIGSGLIALREIFNKSISNITPKYVIIISDGLFSDVSEIVTERTTLELLFPGITYLAVAVGDQVLQSNLITAAGDYRNVHSIFTDDAIYAVLRSTVHTGCPDCFSNTTDLVILLDAVYDRHESKTFYQQIDAIKAMLKGSPISPDGVHVAYARFGAVVHDEFSFLDHLNCDDAISATVVPSRLAQIEGPSNISRALEHVRQNVFNAINGVRSETRKMLVLLTPGPVEELDRIKKVAADLKADGILIAAVTTGAVSEFSALLEIVSDESFMFLINKQFISRPAMLRSLISIMDYVSCEMD